MRKPTNKEVEQAEEYLRQRLSAELSVRNNLEAIMTQAAKKIVDISYKYNIPPKQFRFSANRQLQKDVESVIEWLRSLIEDYTYTLAVADHEDKEDAIIAYISQETFGKTLEQRIDEYTSRFGGELEVAIAAGLFYGISKDKLLSTINACMDAPMRNAIIVSAIADGYNIPQRLNIATSYGVGRTVSSRTALSDLTQYTVALGWMQYLAITAREKGSIGYWVKRGSSYPCAQCDDEVGFHTDWNKMPPFHRHCKCIAIPMYE